MNTGTLYIRAMVGKCPALKRRLIAENSTRQYSPLAAMIVSITNQKDKKPKPDAPAAIGKMVR